MKSILTISAFLLILSLSAQNIFLRSELGYNGMVNLSEKLCFRYGAFEFNTGIGANIKKNMFVNSTSIVRVYLPVIKDMEMYLGGGYSAFVPTERGFTSNSYIIETGISYKQIGLGYSFTKMQYYKRPFIGLYIYFNGKSFIKRS